MSRQSKLSWGLPVLIAGAAIAMNAVQADAEPSVHYADAPAALPAPIIYETTRQTTTVTHTESPTNVIYRRTYTAPTCTTREVVYETPVVRYEEPVVYTRTYVAPRRVVRVRTTPPCSPRKLYRHSPHHRWYYRPWYPARRHHPVHRWHHSRGNWPRGWGLSVGHHRGHHGHRGSGFSFYLNR